MLTVSSSSLYPTQQIIKIGQFVTVIKNVSSERDFLRNIVWKFSKCKLLPRNKQYGRIQ